MFDFRYKILLIALVSISACSTEPQQKTSPKKPKAKLGDIYQLGNHRVMCGDATKDLDKLMGSDVIDIIFIIIQSFFKC